MRTLCVMGLMAALLVPASAQTRKPPARKPGTPPPPPLEKVAADLVCPAVLGVGVTSKTSYCDVLTGRDPAGGILVKLPSHQGPVALSFNLHNRQTYSEEQIKARRAFAKYTATIGV